MAYTLTLPLLVGTLGGVTTYLATGERPKELKDYFFPRTGRLDRYGKPERISYPSYMKDIYHMMMDPLGTIGGKVNPGLNSIIEMFENKDFYNVKIFEQSKDPSLLPRFGKFVSDFAEFASKQFVPFSLRNMLQERAVGAGALGQIAPWFGVSPAPALVNKTPAERKLSEFVKDRIGGSPMTKEQAAEKDTRAKAVNLMRQGKPLPPELLKDMGGLSKGQISNTVKKAATPSFEGSLGSLNLSQMIEIYRLANDEEKGFTLEALGKKVATSLQSDPTEVVKNLAELQKIIGDKETVNRVTNAAIGKYMRKK
jgi:hypothetical protein